MRIAIFAESFLPKWDGVTNTLCYLLDHLAQTGHDSVMFAPKGEPATYAGTPIVGLPCFTFPLYPDLRLVPPLVNVKRQLQAFRPDLIHVVNPALLGLVGLRHARELDLPIVASYHTDIPGYAKRYGAPFLREPLWAYFRWIHNQADLNLCPSRFTKDELVAHRFERVRLWGRGVDTERFNPNHRDSVWRHRLSGGHPDAPLLLFAGRLAPEKRVDWLRPLLDAIPQVQLAIVGDGPARPELEALFDATPAVFTGYLQGEALS
ncbi:MAG: glycosyltransferase family 1 protein, partial [Anaerolineae bacterium]|nr:glycosyltransferase family 1 protein [Anaerolineae bacterium]